MSFYAELPLQELTEMVTRNPDEVDLRLALVEHFVRHEKFEDALAHVCMAEELSPGNPDVEMWKSLCMIFNGELEEGHELLQRVIRNNPCCEFQIRLVTEVVPLFTGETGDPANADWLPGITDGRDGALPDDFLDRTNSFMDAVDLLQQHTGRGIAALEEHVDRYNADVNARLYLAIAYCGVQRIDDAIRLYREVIRQDGQCSTAYFDLAAIISDPQEAIRLTRQGLQHCPFATHARYNLGMFLMQLNRYEEARQELSRIPADNAVYRDALVAMGMTWEDEGNFQKAAECLEKAVILNPERADLRGKYGQLLFDSGHREAALRELQRALELDPDQYGVWANKGLLHLQAGQHDEALQALQQSLELNPESEDAAINLAVLLAETGQLPKAVEVLEQAVHYHPENPLICQNLGAFYCNLQDLELALFYTDRAIELGADSPAVYWNMANIYCFRNNRERCLKYLGHAIERDQAYAVQFLMDEDFRKYQRDPEFLALCHSVD
jgi:tetratricopeptide (TPR) repeat protein